MPSASLAATILVASAMAAGCTNAASAPLPVSLPAPLLSGHASPAVPGARPRLVFFMNPNGRPCQMQDEILRGMPDLPARADVVYYRTTEPVEIGRFEQYGIRSLPQLIVTDVNGAVLRRATPGIQSDPQVRQLLAP
jgi:thioredoxin 1